MIKKYIDIITKICDVSKWYPIIVILFKVFTLCNTYIMLYINKIILNELSSAIISEAFDVTAVLRVLLLGGGIEISATLLFNAIQYYLGKMKLIYDDKMSIQLAQNVSTLDMSYYDDPVTYNQTRQAGKYRSVILDNFNCLINFFFAIISLIVAFAIAIQFNVIIVILAVGAALPGLFIRRKLKVDHYQMEKKIVAEQRFSEYLLGLFYNRNVEMEMQLYSFNDYIIKKATFNQKKVRDTRIDHSLKNAKYETALLFINKSLHILQQVVLITIIISKKLTIGDYTYYGGVIGNLTSAVNSVVNLVNDIHVNNLKYTEYTQIVRRTPIIKTDGTLKIDITQVHDIEFEHVTFKYPNSDRCSIYDISFKISMGDKIALVGANGAGKTTLIKLLLRFYDPSEGRILLNGIDIREYDLIAYRKIFSTMFQDNTAYLLTVKENIALSDIHIDTDEQDNRLKKILEDLDIATVNGKPLQLDRSYGREFDQDGYVFSKGQQQRLQAARTLFHQGGMYILDEPAASMDAISESKFLNTLVEHTAAKSVIYITHRYNNLTLMDNIIVLKDGRVVESGKHNELINLNGVYNEMFVLQNKDDSRGGSV